MRRDPRRPLGWPLLHFLAQPLPWFLIALALAGAVAAYQVRRPYTIDVGAAGDSLYVRNFYTPVTDEATGRTYRIGNTYSYVSVPGLGGGAPYSVTLSLNPAQAGITTTVILNGVPFLQQQLAAQWQDLTFSVDAGQPQALASRDLVIELRGPPAGGLMLDAVQIGAPGSGFVVPAFTPLAYLAALLLLAYLLLVRVLLRASAPPDARLVGPAALGGTFVLAVILDSFLAGARLPTAALLGYLAAAGAGAHVLLAPAWWLARRLAPEGRILARLLWRPLPWLLVALTLAGAVAAFQVRHAYDIDIGTPADEAYMVNFHDRDQDGATGPTFRATDTYGYIILPGVGGGAPYGVTLTLSPEAPDTPLTLIVNGTTYLRTRLASGWQTVSASVDAAHPTALASRDLVIEIRASRASHIRVDRVQVSVAGPGFVSPTYTALIYLAAVVLLAYLLLGRFFAPLPRGGEGRVRGESRPTAAGGNGGFPPSPQPSPRRGEGVVPLLGAAVVAVALLGTLAAVHLPLTVALPDLVTTGVLAYVLLIATEALARRVVPGAPGGARAVAGLVAGAFVLRFGLMGLPQSVIIDLPYHLKWMHELLAGNLAALTDPHGGLNQPPREWNLAIIIPKSPLFYFLALPLAWLPFDLATALKAFVCVLEASTVLLCYVLLARFAPALGGGQAGVWAGFAYAANPLGFRALAYGILPTILAQWLSVLFFTLLLIWGQRVFRDQGLGIRGWGVATESGTQHAVRGSQFAVRRSQFAVRLALPAGLLLLLTAALVAFPTIAVFNTVIAGGLVLGWWAARRRRMAGILAGGMAGAWGIAVVTYYGVYIVDLVTRTLPALLGTPAAAATPAAPSTPPPSTVHWTGPLDLLGWTADYLVNLLPLLLGLAGLAILWLYARRARTDGVAPRPERMLALLAAWWIAILPIFLVVNYRFDMIGKHLFFTMVPLALGGGIALHALARRGGVARLLAGVLAAALAWSALVFWIMRLVSASS